MSLWNAASCSLLFVAFIMLVTICADYCDRSGLREEYVDPARKWTLGSMSVLVASILLLLLLLFYHRWADSIIAGLAVILSTLALVVGRRIHNELIRAFPPKKATKPTKTATRHFLLRWRRSVPKQQP